MKSYHARFAFARLSLPPHRHSFIVAPPPPAQKQSSTSTTAVWRRWNFYKNKIHDNNIGLSPSHCSCCHIVSSIRAAWEWEYLSDDVLRPEKNRCASGTKLNRAEEDEDEEGNDERRDWINWYSWKELGPSSMRKKARQSSPFLYSFAARHLAGVPIRGWE